MATSTLYQENFEEYSIGTDMTSQEYYNYDHSGAAGRGFTVVAGNYGALNGGSNSAPFFTQCFRYSPAYSEYVNVGNSSLYNIAGNSAAICFWIKPFSLNTEKVIISRGVYGVGGFYLDLYNNGHWLLVQNTTTVLDVTYPSTDIFNWVHWAFVKTGGGKWQAFRNGVECSYNVQTTGDPTSATNNLIIGAYDNFTLNHNGEMGDVRWFNRTITPTEINTIYNGGNVSSGLIGWWKFQETSGTTAFDSSSSGINASIGNAGSDPNFFFNDPLPPATVTPGYSSWVYLGQNANYVNDVIIDFDIISNTSNFWGVCFRVANGNGYLFSYDTTGASPVVKLSTFVPIDPFNNTLVHDFSSGANLINIHHVKLEMLGDTLNVYLNGAHGFSWTDGVSGRHPNGTWGFSAFGSGLEIDNVVVLNPLPYIPQLTNTQYVESADLQEKTTVQFQLNLGSSLQSAIDISQYNLSGGLGEINEGMADKSIAGTAGVILPSLNLQLDNTQGLFNKYNSSGMFAPSSGVGTGYLNNSLISITSKYQRQCNGAFDDTAFNNDAFDAGFSWRDINPGTYYNGLVKSTQSTWDTNNRIFNAYLLPAANILASTKIPAGIISTPCNLSTLVYSILNQTSITKYLTVNQANISLGYDLTGCITSNNIAALTDCLVKDILDEISAISSSVYWIDRSNIFHMEPLNLTGSTNWSISLEDIKEFQAIDFYWGQFDYISWLVNGETLNSPVQSYPAYLSGVDPVADSSGDANWNNWQYDLIPVLDLSGYKLLSTATTDKANRRLFVTNMLKMYQHLASCLTIKVKANPDLRVNNIVTIQNPTQLAFEGLMFNSSDLIQGYWNSGAYYSISTPGGGSFIGIPISSSTKWRVIEITRELTNEYMVISAVAITLSGSYPAFETSV